MHWNRNYDLYSDQTRTGPSVLELTLPTTENNLVDANLDYLLMKSQYINTTTFALGDNLLPNLVNNSPQLTKIDFLGIYVGAF